MIDKLLALLALAVLIGFLAILVIYVPRIDLGVIIGATILLVIYDFLIHERRLRRHAADRETGQG